MNPYVQEWIWVYSKAKGVAKYVLLAIGRKIEATKRGFETEPLPLEEIAQDTGLADSTVREHIKHLSGPTGELEVVKAPRRGEVHRYKLRRELQLPLIDMAPARVRRRLAAVTSPVSGGEVDSLSPPVGGGVTADSQRRGSAFSSPLGGGAVSGDAMSLEVRTEVPTSKEQEAVADFILWFQVEFQSRRKYEYRIRDRAAVEEKVAWLLATIPVDRLKAMAILMFEAERDSFILDSDYSLHVLHHKATYLEGIAMRRLG